MSPELKYALIAFGIGCLIVVLEWNMAKKKKEGVTWTDKKRMRGILGVSAGIAALVYFIIITAGD
ncbi:MAG: hypothetical protein M5U08_05365 [Burkholderiales bacterium]|nr:hypothetical protein [Burkholderiales bacterium]